MPLAGLLAFIEPYSLFLDYIVIYNMLYIQQSLTLSLLMIIMIIWMTAFLHPFQQGSVILGWMDAGWMTSAFSSFSTAFQSYQDNGWVLMKGCVQWNPTYDCKDPCLK